MTDTRAANGLNKVIVVEDSPPVAFALCQMLRKLGYEPEHFVDGREASIKLNEKSRAETASIILIISDIMMPLMSGFELREWVLKQPELKHKPFIFYSALTDPKLIERAIAASSHGYIVKPASFTRLQQKLASIFAAPRVEI